MPAAQELRIAMELTTDDYLKDYIANLDPSLVESTAQIASTLRLVRLMIANELAMHEVSGETVPQY